MSKLYIVPTPVGNLEDMTFRAIRVLKEADLVLAEDTRTSSVLLKKYDIPTHMEAHHKFNEHKTVEAVRDRILAGLDVALISDAGTPGISDPGFLLVRTCVEAGIEAIGARIVVGSGHPGMDAETAVVGDVHHIQHQFDGNAEAKGLVLTPPEMPEISLQAEVEKEGRRMEQVG